MNGAEEYKKDDEEGDGNDGVNCGSQALGSSWSSSDTFLSGLMTFATMFPFLQLLVVLMHVVLLLDGGGLRGGRTRCLIHLCSFPSNASIKRRWWCARRCSGEVVVAVSNEVEGRWQYT